MRYSLFEALAMGVSLCAVVGTSLLLLNNPLTVSEIIGQALVLVVMFGGLHWGRKGALGGFLVSASIYGMAAFAGYRGEPADAAYLFLFRSLVYAILAFVAGELNVRLKYLFARLEHRGYVDDITTLYNSKYMAQLISKHTSEYDRYGSRFSLADLTVRSEPVSTLKRKTRRKIVKEIGNSVIRPNIRCADEAARVDDTRFVILFPNTDFDGATSAAVRIKGKITGYLDRHGVDTDTADAVVTEILEYPRHREEIESFSKDLPGVQERLDNPRQGNAETGVSLRIPRTM